MPPVARDASRRAPPARGCGCIAVPGGATGHAWSAPSPLLVTRADEIGDDPRSQPAGLPASHARVARVAPRRMAASLGCRCMRKTMGIPRGRDAARATPCRVGYRPARGTLRARGPGLNAALRAPRKRSQPPCRSVWQGGWPPTIRPTQSPCLASLLPKISSRCSIRRWRISKRSRSTRCMVSFVSCELRIRLGVISTISVERTSLVILFLNR